VRGIRGRRDATHAPIRDGLRARGWSVEDNGDAGNGKPDLIAGKNGVTYLVECKSLGKEETEEQERKRLGWKGGPWLVAYCIADVIAEHVRRGFVG
jgi:hypothetical protein